MKLLFVVVAASLLLGLCARGQTCVADPDCAGRGACNGKYWSTQVLTDPLITRAMQRCVNIGLSCCKDPCSGISAPDQCVRNGTCLPLSETSTTNVLCVTRDKVCWAFNQTVCPWYKYCQFSTTSGCFWLTPQLTPPTQGAVQGVGDACPKMNPFVAAMIALMFISVAVAVVVVAVIVIRAKNQREKEDREEEEAMAKGQNSAHL